MKFKTFYPQLVQSLLKPFSGQVKIVTCKVDTFEWTLMVFSYFGGFS